MSTQTIERKLENAMTVADLIAELKQMPQDAHVLFACDYGDITHTQQALPVESIDEHDRAELVESAYSQSDIALEDDGEKEYFCPKCEEEWIMTVCPKCGGTCVDEAGNLVEADESLESIVILR